MQYEKAHSLSGPKMGVELLFMRSSEESAIGEQENAYCLSDERSGETFFSIKRIIGQSYCYTDNKQHDVGNLGPVYLVEKTTGCIDEENKECGKHALAPDGLLTYFPELAKLTPSPKTVKKT